MNQIPVELGAFSESSKAITCVGSTYATIVPSSLVTGNNLPAGSFLCSFLDINGF